MAGYEVKNSAVVGVRAEGGRRDGYADYVGSEKVLRRIFGPFYARSWHPARPAGSSWKSDVPTGTFSMWPDLVLMSLGWTSALKR